MQWSGVTQRVMLCAVLVLQEVHAQGFASSGTTTLSVIIPDQATIRIDADTPATVTGQSAVTYTIRTVGSGRTDISTVLSSDSENAIGEALTPLGTHPKDNVPFKVLPDELSTAVASFGAVVRATASSERVNSGAWTLVKTQRGPKSHETTATFTVSAP